MTQAVKSVYVDKEFQDLIPPATEEELAQLEANIRAEGCRDALVLWRGILLDGHQRLRICQKHGIPYQIVEVDLPDRLAAQEWIVHNQMGRRNLPPFVKIELELKLEKIKQSLGRERKLANLKRGTEKPQSSIIAPHECADQDADVPDSPTLGNRGNIGKTQNSPVLGTTENPPQKTDPIDYERNIAAKTGFGHGTIHKAMVIIDKAPETVLEALRKGESTINAEYRKLKRQEENQNREDELAELATKLPPIDHRWEVAHGDFRDICQEVGDGTVDVIIADPPYSKESLVLYEPLAQAAARVLKPGGSLLLMCGQYYIPEIFQAITPHLRYHWLLAYLTPGGQAPQIWPRQVNAFWKPILWFTLGDYDHSWIGDVIHSKGNDKRFHEWGQSESGMSALIEKFTRPGDLILDPFVGGGTTGVVAVPLGRRFLGIDCNIQAVEVARRRIAVTANEVQETSTTKEVTDVRE